MLFDLFTKNKHIETEEEKQARINKKLYGDLTPEQYLKKHDRDAQPSSKLWAARNQILKILRENNLHIEIGSDCIAGIGLWLCLGMAPWLYHLHRGRPDSYRYPQAQGQA